MPGWSAENRIRPQGEGPTLITYMYLDKDTDISLYLVLWKNGQKLQSLATDFPTAFKVSLAMLCQTFLGTVLVLLYF